MAIPSDWQNPIRAGIGQVQFDVDPTRLLPSRADLHQSRIDVQRGLIRSNIRRWTPVRVTESGVIVDGDHMVRAAAEEGTLIEVLVVSFLVVAVGEAILNLPMR